MKPLSKADQAGRYSRKRPRATKEPESALQSFVDDYLAARGVYSLRIPDGLFSSLRAALVGRWNWLWIVVAKVFGGLPDNLCLVRHGEYCLALLLEAKTKSGLHGKQIQSNRDLHWHIVHTPEEAKAAIDAFLVAAEEKKR